MATLIDTEESELRRLRGLCASLIVISGELITRGEKLGMHATLARAYRDRIRQCVGGTETDQVEPPIPKKG